MGCLGEIRLFGAGKILLFGEHAAVFAYPAVGMALRQGITVRIVPSARWHFPPITGSDPTILRRFAEYISRICDSAAERRLRGSATFETEIPVSGGFGSSAALCSAIAGGILAEGGNRGAWAPSPPDSSPSETTLRARWALAHSLERFFHGTPSGIDTGLSVLGGVQHFSFPDAEVPGALPRARSLPGVPGALIVGSVPRLGTTKSLVASVGQKMNAGDRATKAHIDALGRIAQEAAEALSHLATPEQIGLLADTAHRHLRSLGLSSPATELILEAGKRSGSVGGKISGAGGGGAFFLVYPDLERAEGAIPLLQASAAERNIGLGQLYPIEASSDGSKQKAL